MSSPLHKFLFSPPPSPPLAVGASTDPNARFTPLRVQKVAADGQPDTFKLSVPHQSNRTRSAQSSSGNAMQVDVEAANAYDDNGKAGSPPVWSRLFSPRIRVLQARYVPRPLIRLGAFVLALFAAALLLTHVVLPVVFPLEEAGSAGLKAVAAPRVAVAAGAPVAHVAEAQAPPVVHRVPQVAPHPRSFRADAHPLPETHELLALQSYILESPANHLPDDLDASVPLDAARIIGNRAASRLRGRGSPEEQAWLNELTTEAGDQVVLWFGSSTPPYYALEGIISRHGHGRRPELISLAKREDGPAIRDVLKRLGHNVDEVPVLVLGGEVFDASTDRMDELRSSGQLAQKLAQIGWR